MSFQPVLPLSGYAGWTFLKRTMAVQQETMQASAATARDAAYFRDKIGTVDSAAELVADRRLLTVAVTAYGLEEDINYRAFLEKILAGGTTDADALANKLADKQYLKFAAAFGFGDLPAPRTKLSSFADETLALYQRQTFEAAVGEQNNTYRLALNAEHELAAIAAGPGSETTKWFTILGNSPLRAVVETALGLPSSFAQIDLDQQLSVVRARSQSLFGDSNASQFSKPEALEKMIRSYVVRAEIAAISAPSSPASIALQILGA